jgi:carbonic anhydrase/SulP family sulfate permease
MESPLTTREKLREYWAADLTAGLVVALVALPLCLGIALASNAPLFSGLLAGIVGGVLVGAISQSHTSVTGPAAGLTAVVAAQIAELGSFQAFLVAVVVAGAIQIVLGVARAGSIADFVPSSVIKGLLAAIGLILILKQIPHLLGHDRDSLADMAFQQANQENTFSELIRMISDMHLGAALIGVLSLVLLLAWERSKRLKALPIPAPLVVVLSGAGLQLLLGRLGGSWSIGDSHLVQVPVAESLRGLAGFLQLPDWSALMRPEVHVAAVTVALVASLETLLNVEAVDKLDLQKRVTPTNRELIAQGAGNIVSGLIGGLPVTSVIVRSSVNINAGSKTKTATIVHGLILLLCVTLLPAWLNHIPLASLAAVLIVTGFKLTKPKIYRQMWQEGWNQFLPFVVTVMAIVLTDLLVGILIGLGFSILFILQSNLRRPLHQVRERHVGGEVLRIELSNQVSFLNRAALSKALESVPRGGHVLLDARNTHYIDVDVLDLIREYEEDVAPARRVRVSLLGFQEHYEQVPDRVQYMDYTTRELQEALTPEIVLRILQEGNERFRSGRPLTRDLKRQLQATADGRHPLAAVLSGASSRTPIELIFDVGLGEIFCARVTGNFLSVGVLGSLEYACRVSGARLIVVLGHNNSEIVRIAIESFAGQLPDAVIATENLQPIIAKIQESIDPQRLAGWSNMDLSSRQECVDDLYRRHLERTMLAIPAQSGVLRDLLQRGQINVVGAMYDVRSGQVAFLPALDCVNMRQ